MSLNEAIMKHASMRYLQHPINSKLSNYWLRVWGESFLLAS